MLEQGALPSEAGTSSPMLRRLEYRRFGHTGVYRDVTFALLFGLQLVCVLTIAVVNGGRVHASPAGSLPPPPPPLGALEPPASASRLSAEMLLILAVASGVAALLSALWLVMLQTGARSLIWSGAALATALALANAAWLFSLGGAAGTALGLASFCLCLGSVAYLLYHRSFLDFSACLLSAVAHVLRAYPATLALAAAAAAAAMLYAVLWSAALAATAQLPRQAAASSLLLLSFFWTLQTIKAVVHATVAGTVASWYFLSPHVPPSPTKRALRRAVTTSFGSLCLGALLASSLQTTRVLSRVASRHAPCGAGVRSGCLCVLGFVDVLLRFCNEYAYTQVMNHNREWQLSVVRTSSRLASAAAAAARTRRRRSLARRLATRLAADVRCARPTVRSVACAALRAALRALLRLHCLSLLLLLVVVLLLLVQMLLLARRGSATGLDARVASI